MILGKEQTYSRNAPTELSQPHPEIGESTGVGEAKILRSRQVGVRKSSVEVFFAHTHE